MGGPATRRRVVSSRPPSFPSFRPPMLRLAAVAVLLFASSAHAQDVVSPEAVVTASRLPEDARRTGRHVTVISAADIARSPARSLDELLRAEAGVAVVARGGAGTQSDVTLRGATFNGVLFLVDGARFNDPMTGHFLSDFPVPLAEIARVEVLRGPAAAVWGPDALGGVVHVVTHTGAWAGGTAAAAIGGLTAGGQSTFHGDAAARRATPRGALSAALDVFTTDGQPVRSAAGVPVAGRDGDVRTDARRAAATAAGAATWGALRVSGRVAGDARAFGAFQFYTPFPSDTAREATETLWAQARIVPAAAGRTAWSVGVAARQHRDRYTFNPAATTSDHTSRRATLTAEASRAVSGALTLGAGASAELRGITSNTLGTHADPSGGVFGTARYAPLPALTLTLAGRLDADATFGVQATPSVSAAFAAAPTLTLRASAGRAVRAPDYVERFLNTLAPRPNGNLGNPALRAERARSAEAGADYAPLGGVTLRATAFWRQTDDLIDYARLAPTDPYFLAQNVLRATAAGVEAEARLARRLGPDARLSANLAYTYTHIALDGIVPGAQYKYALSHAPSLVQGRAGLDVRGARLAVEGQWRDRYTLPSYLMLDARLAADVPGVRAVEAFVSVRNLTGTDAAEIFGAPLPGRTVLGGVRARIGG